MSAHTASPATATEDFSKEQCNRSFLPEFDIRVFPFLFFILFVRLFIFHFSFLDEGFSSRTCNLAGKYLGCYVHGVLLTNPQLT